MLTLKEKEYIEHLERELAIERQHNKAMRGAAEYVLGRREIVQNVTGCEMKSTMPILLSMLAEAVDNGANR